jgi:uncharacterized protein YhdP
MRAGWLRTTIIIGIVMASFLATLAVAYEMAVARVPRQRAAFESLVRAQTGLDIRFNELSFRLGWYGPEALFKRVELGEPGRSNVLLRAPQLIVGINAWQTMRTGRLVSGRITLIAPDIDLEKLGRSPPIGAQPNRSAPTTTAASDENRTRVLERWKGGIIDLQGGTLKVPDPAGAASSLTLQIRRAALKRAGKEWSGHALVFLPERLGRTARVVFQLNGDVSSPTSFSGGVRFEGVRLAFSSWRGVLGDLPRLAGNLPQLGTGDVTFDLTLKNGKVEKASGEVKGFDLVLGTPAWLEPVRASRSTLKLDYVTGSWQFQRRGETSQLQIEQLVLGRDQKDSPLPQFTVEMTPGHLRSALAAAPLTPITTLARWIAPELTPSDVSLDGKLQSLEVDWNDARPEGFRLAASAHIAEATATSITRGFTLTSLPLRLHATENELSLEVDAPAAGLQFAADPEHPVEALKLVSRVRVARAGAGWRVAIPRFEFKDESAEGEMTGTLIAETPEGEPLIDLRGAVPHADIAKLQARFASGVAQVFGSAGLRVGAGRIESGAFELRGRLDALDSARFVGSFNVRDARIPSDGSWPESQGLDANVAWNGSRISATVSDGRTGDFDLESVDAQWDATGKQPARLTGRAHGRLESALALMRSNPDLQRQAPHLQELAASGNALFDFDVTIPDAASLPPGAAPPQMTARISTVLEGVQFRLAPDLPAVESLRGAVTYDAGRLQRSTLSATWLGGPLTLRIAERRDRRGSAIAVQAQGFVDARKLVALSQVRPLADVSGETAWSGDFAYTPPNGATPARWVGRADSALIGVTSDLPAPLAKAAGAPLPLHIEISGTGNSSELRANLAERLRAAVALDIVDGEDWRIDRAAVRLGAGTVTLPEDNVIQVRGHVRRIDAPAYVVAWQKMRDASPDTHADVDISSDELAFGERVYDDATVQVAASATSPGASVLRLEAPSFGVLTGTLQPQLKEVVFSDLQMKRLALAGTGSLRCADDFATCRADFELESTDVAASLADLGFRPDLSATRGALSGQIAWQPRRDTPWLESAAGTLSMRFEDGVAHRPVAARPDSASWRPLALLTVPALLNGISRHGAAAPVSAAPDTGPESGDLKFRRLDGHFQLRDGQATTSDLHFDGDVEILVRGRMGLLAGDYDHEAWVLKGEERLPQSIRRLASTPRVAAAWLTLRELIGGDSASRSRIVLHMRGPWNEPVVTVE